MGPLFTKNYNFLFTFNHHNYLVFDICYQRFDILCHISQQITEIKVTHAEMHKDFINGLFSMKTTKKAFSRLPVDLTLE